jgi:hypothetical protein
MGSRELTPLTQFPTPYSPLPSFNPQSAIRNRMRLAYFAPPPPSKSGIADYNSELLPYLAQGAEISVFVAEGDELRENHGLTDFSIHDANDFDHIHNQMRQFDGVTDRLIHGLMRFDAERRGGTICGPKQKPVALQ